METFYKYGFFVLLVTCFLLTFTIRRQSSMKIEGQLSWVDLYSNNADETASFLEKTLNIKILNSLNDNINYKVLRAGKGIMPFGGVMQLTDELKNKGINNSTLAYLTVLDYDLVSSVFVKNGAKEVETDIYAEGMKFGIFLIPGNVTIALAQYMK